jgi:hypothetical protein
MIRYLHIFVDDSLCINTRAGIGVWDQDYVSIDGL